MNLNPMDASLEEMIEATAQQLLAACQPGASSDPLTALKQLLLGFLEQALEQHYQEALREYWRQEQAQQN